jgi:hypothetical protein
MAFLVEGFVCLFETHCTASSAVLRNSALTVANRRLQAYFATFRLTSLHSGLLRYIQAYFATFRLTSRHSGLLRDIQAYFATFRLSGYQQ